MDSLESGTEVRMYGRRMREEALDLWFAHIGEMSVDDFVSELGYPSGTTMRLWIRDDPRHDPDKVQYRSKPVLTKLEAIRRVAEGESASRVARDVGVGDGVVAYWADRYAEGGTAALLPRPTLRKGAGMAGRRKGAGRPPAPVMQAPPPAASGELPDDPAALKAMVEELRMDNALLREVLDVLKADPGCNPADLSNRERAAAVAALEGRFPLPALRARMGIAKSTYHYNLELLTRPDGPDVLGDAVEEEFRAEGCARGYRAVTERLRRRPEPIRASEKRVRAKMRERGLEVVYRGRRRRWSSYAGEQGERPANLPLGEDGTHDFRADAPNERWVSDITEFRLPDDPRKVYLSPVVDLFDMRPVGWSASTSPDAALADSSLEMACSRLREGEHPMVHTDGGIQYWWPGWASICARHGLVRSMSRKGCSPDNAAMEGFFGMLKNEFFYGRDWSGVTAEQLISMIGAWMGYICGGRLKAFRDREGGPLYYDTIDGRRRRLGLAV